MPPKNRLALPFETGQIAVPSQEPILIVNARPDPVYQLFPAELVDFLQDSKPIYDRLCLAGYTDANTAAKQYALAIVHPSRARDESRAFVARAFDALKPGGILIVDGAKTDGIESLLKAVKKIVPVTATLSKAHGKVFWLSKSTTAPEFLDWQDAGKPRQNPAGYWTSAGNFSADKIDKGSAELVPHLLANLSGIGADLGAGWGYLAEQALADNPEITQLHLYEASANALANAKQNLTDPRARFHWQDVTQLAKDEPFDFIISNPPFHTSRKADPALGQRFIETAARLLKPKGAFYMVANRQLSYEATLAERFQHVETLAQTNHFKCILARRPKQ